MSEYSKDEFQNTENTLINNENTTELVNDISSKNVTKINFEENPLIKDIKKEDTSSYVKAVEPLKKTTQVPIENIDDVPPIETLVKETPIENRITDPVVDPQKIINGELEVPEKFDLNKQSKSYETLIEEKYGKPSYYSNESKSIVEQEKERIKEAEELAQEKQIEVNITENDNIANKISISKPTDNLVHDADLKWKEKLEENPLVKNHRNYEIPVENTKPTISPLAIGLLILAFLLIIAIIVSLYLGINDFIEKHDLGSISTLLNNIKF